MQSQELQYANFAKPGPENTKNALECAKNDADRLGIKKIVIASTTGSTIKEALLVFDPKKYELICVTHSYNWNEQTFEEFNPVLRKELGTQGVSVVSGTLAFSGVESALLRKFQFFDFVSMFARVLRTIFSDGIKVAIECTLMATDAGIIKQGEDVIAVAGTGHGSDSVCWIKAASTRQFENIRVKAVLAKPQ